MAAAQPVSAGRVEAVIISGPRRGEIVTLPEADLAFSAEDEALIEEMIASAHRMEAIARGMAEDTRALVSELRASRSAA
jgi:hypothetical protein